MSANISLDPASRPLRVTAASASAVTPSDAVNLPAVAQAGLYVIVTGNLAFHDASGQTVTLLAVPVFTRIPIAAKRVLATGTTATVLALN